MNSGPRVSVIVPAFNAERLIGETLDSILEQTYRNCEIIVVDDGSTDQTSQIVQSYGSRVRYYYQNNSGGCSVPRNTGIMNSSGEFLCFIDADDIMVANRITRQVDFMKRNPRVGLVFCDYRNFTEAGPLPNSHFETCPSLWSQLKDQKEQVLERACKYLVRENFGIAGSFMIRKKLLAFEAGFEPTLKACEDFHFYFRLSRHTSAGIINEIGMLRRLHGGNMSGNPVKMLSEGIRSRAMLRDNEQDPEVRRHLCRYISRCQDNLARYHADQGRFLQSLWYDLQVLTGPFIWPEIGSSCRTMLRTIAMAAGMHRPKNTRR